MCIERDMLFHRNLNEILSTNKKIYMQKFKNQSSMARKFKNVCIFIVCFLSVFCCFFVFVLDNGSYKFQMLLSLHYTQTSTNQKWTTKTPKKETIQCCQKKNMGGKKCTDFMLINIMERQWICVNGKGW